LIIGNSKKFHLGAQGTFNPNRSPQQENIAACRALKAQGHHIIIATGRRMRTHKGNTAAVIADIGAVTLQQVTRHKLLSL